MTRLPTELIGHVIFYHISSLPGGSTDVGKSYKPPWHAVEPLTLVSKTFRTIALEAWFETFFATLPAHVLDAWPEVGTWTRELHCVEHGSDHDKLPFQWDLRAFNRLRKLRLDFNPLVSNAMLLLRFAHPKHVAGNLQELEVHDISWPSPLVMEVISSAFPQLRVLKLAQERIWCGLCNICCLATFKEQPPQEIIYENYVGLPMHYGQFLADLEHLHTVCLTVGYGHGGNTSITENNENLWSGECDACMAMMYATDDFRVDWVERKKSQPRPPSLRRVEWRFKFVEQDEPVIEEPEAERSGDDN